MQPVRSSSYRVQILTYLQMSKNFLRHTYNSEDTKKKKERNEKIKERNKRKRKKNTQLATSHHNTNLLNIPVLSFIIIF